MPKNTGVKVRSSASKSTGASPHCHMESALVDHKLAQIIGICCEQCCVVDFVWTKKYVHKNMEQ